jgi:hypothetical protein
MALGNALNDLKKYDEAEVTLRESLAALSEDPSNTPEARAPVMLALAESLTGLRRPEDAERALLDALTALESAREHEAGKMRLAARSRLASLYTTLGRTEDAARYADAGTSTPLPPPQAGPLLPEKK